MKTIYTLLCCLFFITHAQAQIENGINRIGHSDDDVDQSRISPLSLSQTKSFSYGHMFFRMRMNYEKRKIKVKHTRIVYIEPLVKVELLKPLDKEGLTSEEQAFLSYLDELAQWKQADMQIQMNELIYLNYFTYSNLLMRNFHDLSEKLETRLSERSSTLKLTELQSFQLEQNKQWKANPIKDMKFRPLVSLAAGLGLVFPVYGGDLKDVIQAKGPAYKLFFSGSVSKVKMELNVLIFDLKYKGYGSDITFKKPTIIPGNYFTYNRKNRFTIVHFQYGVGYPIVEESFFSISPFVGLDYGFKSRNPLGEFASFSQDNGGELSPYFALDFDFRLSETIYLLSTQRPISGKSVLSARFNLSKEKIYGYKESWVFSFMIKFKLSGGYLRLKS